MNKLIGTAMGALMLSASPVATANASGQSICVYDLLGTSGDMYNMAKDWALAAKGWGGNPVLEGYTDERVATQDFITGKCDALFATGFRTRQFNPVAAAIDSLGATTIIKDDKVDMAASYDVVRKLIQLFTVPATQNLMEKNGYEVAGIVPFGTAYPVVNDRNIKTVEALAGKKIASFDYDKAQAVMIQKIGAQPVSADITNFAAKFNNGSVDMIAAPAMAYKPLELYRGIGNQGAINRFPIMILSYQMIVRNSKFPDGFAVQSRKYWSGEFDRARSLISKAEASIPKATWGDLTPENMIKYTVMLRESREDIANQNIYDKTGLRILKKIRCNVNSASSECSTNSETWK